MVSFSSESTHHPNPYVRDILLSLLILSPSSFATPIRDSSTPSNWLAYLTALLIFSAVCLSAFKVLFVRHRQITNLRGPAPLVRGQCAHGSLKSFKVSAYTTCKGGENCRAGFLIGLFGSPSFEIRSKPSELTLIYPGADTSGSSQTQDVSGDTTTTYKTKSSTFSTGPVALFSDRTPWHIHRHSKKPSPFSASLAKGTISRLLPSQLSFDLGRVGRRKRQAEIPDPQDGLPWPHNRLEHTTLRLVKLYTEPEASLPFGKGAEAFSGFPSLAPAARGFAVAHLNRPCPSPISPLPPLPNHDADDKDQVLGVSPLDNATGHPYKNALLTLVRPGRRSSRRASLSPSLSVIEETCYTSIPDLPGLTSEQINPTSPTCETTRNPPTTFNAYDTLRRREKLKSSSLRNRRSPPLGPSPLRSMMLPDSDVAEDDMKHTAVNELKDYIVPEQKIQYRRIGLGLPSVKLSPPQKERIKSQGSNENASGGSRGSIESMLDFLRELAEETREWDESIVLNEGFRNMMQHSQAILGCTSLENVNVKYSAPRIPPKPGGRNRTPPKFVSFWLEDSPSP